MSVTFNPAVMAFSGRRVREVFPVKHATVQGSPVITNKSSFAAKCNLATAVSSNLQILISVLHRMKYNSIWMNALLTGFDGEDSREVHGRRQQFSGFWTWGGYTLLSVYNRHPPKVGSRPILPIWNRHYPKGHIQVCIHIAFMNRIRSWSFNICFDHQQVMATERERDIFGYFYSCNGI